MRGTAGPEGSLLERDEIEPKGTTFPDAVYVPEEQLVGQALRTHVFVLSDILEDRGDWEKSDALLTALENAALPYDWTVRYGAVCSFVQDLFAVLGVESPEAEAARLASTPTLL